MPENNNFIYTFHIKLINTRNMNVGVPSVGIGTMYFLLV